MIGREIALRESGKKNHVIGDQVSDMTSTSNTSDNLASDINLNNSNLPKWDMDKLRAQEGYT